MSLTKKLLKKCFKDIYKRKGDAESSKEAVDRILHKRKCPLCKGTGDAFEVHDVEEYYKE